MRNFLLLLLLAINHALLAQFPVPYQDAETKLFGYKNPAGKIIIPPVFHTALPFSEDVTFVREPAGGIAIPIQKGGSVLGNDFHVAQAQQVFLGGIYGATGPDNLDVKQEEEIPTKYNRIRFNYIKPWKRIMEVKPPGLSVEKQEDINMPHLITHKKKGLNYMHPFSVFDREEHESLIAYPGIFRLRMPFKFEGKPEAEPFGFGLEYQFWYDSYGACSEIQHIAFLVKSDHTLDVFSLRSKYDDALVCGSFNCWNGRKKMAYQDLTNYKQAGTFKSTEDGIHTLEVIRNKDVFYIYLDDVLLYREELINCAFGYGDSPIPLFLNKGSFRFYPGSEYNIYRKS